ncbi:hypothetical protein B9Z47_02410 [Limnohabitans sp. 2KL-1]|uniref:hypothetical protein n=1 Tax=Limnohabitans sp. 2KL-1 TaxID=1100699 RepID=UPI000D3C91B3|nr:hypothetical protein [Limnohabitans sp. 2KL-1]PUE50623.1 hypothetical protein B9Z47_02410 [Limnohabitans sp. 2KL-1]
MTSERQSLDAQALQALGQAATPLACTCPVGACTGWESVTEDRWPAAQMTTLGSLRAMPADPYAGTEAEPTFEEFHLRGTRYESPDAPIAPRYFPYNRCDVLACGPCQRVLLKYTEFGGYYVDHRVRALQPELVVDAPEPNAP